MRALAPADRLDWPLFLLALARDELIRLTGSYWLSSPPPFPTKYISPTGLAMSCDAFGGEPYLLDGRLRFLDLSTYRNLPEGAVIWMRIEALPIFNREVLPGLKSRFVLVTGESDWHVPSHFRWAARTLVQSGKLIHWFSSNYDGTEYPDLITPVPLGLEYPKRNELTLNAKVGSYRAVKKTPAEHEREWEAMAAAAPPLQDRLRRAVADFHFNDTAGSRRFGEDRTEVYERLRDNPSIAFLPRRPMEPMRLRYARHAFALYVFGRGMEGYRVWEALQMGCIAITRRSPLDVLYQGLPVVSVEDWDEITEANMARWYAQYGPSFERTRVHEVLSLRYWTDQIRAAARAG